MNGETRILRRLMLARHAKSSWGDPALGDHDRPLNRRGRRAAPMVAGELVALDCIPDVVYSSTSARTRETWALMEPHFSGHTRVEFVRDLYLASPRRVLTAIASAPADAEKLMILGHNPSTHAIAAYLSRSGPEDEIVRLRTKFPTGAVAVVDLAGDRWTAVEHGGELIHYIVPRRLEDGTRR